MSADGGIHSLANLEVKGIIAVKAMSQISVALNHAEDAEHYSVCLCDGGRYCNVADHLY